MQPPPRTFLAPLQRIRIWYALLIVIAAIFVVRLFYLQVIRHDYYQKAALKGQLKEYEIPASRGTIMAHNGTAITPLVLNEKLYTAFVDPVYVKDPHTAASEVQRVIGGNANDIEKQLKTPDTRYVVLAKKLTKEQKTKLDDLHLKGIGTRETPYRTYPDGQLASQILGFVNDDGEGKYGLEQALDGELKGTPGQLKAITDAQGVPLVGNKNNVITEPKQGKQLVLTIDVGMQQQLEDILKQGVADSNAKAGSAYIMEISSGAIKAMANFPTYNPAEFYKVKDGAVFANPAVGAPLEVGSIMKTLTVSAGIDQGVITKDSTYYDPGTFVVDGLPITNVEGNSVIGTQSIQQLLILSLNTGATWILKQMGGGEINQQARERWHDYMVNHYHLGKATGIEQNYEADGTIPDPNEGFGRNIQYANTAFGQGMTATLLQMGGAVSAVLNGGTYYQPHLVEGYIDPATNKEVTTPPKILNDHVVKPETGQALQELMEGVVANNYSGYKMAKPLPQYSVGGKTGTAQIGRPGGGYYEDRFNGTFIGFVGGDKAQYLIAVRIEEPHVNNFAGAGAAAPVFGKLSSMLLNNFGVTPRTAPR
jgi:cell division protein FtsI/penicillin-binding protein 2